MSALRRRTIILIVGVYVVVCVSMICRNRIGARTTPSQIVSQQYDFGQGRVGEVIEHEFVVNNPFKVPVHIDKVTTNCSCTLAKKVPQVIPASASISIPVRVKLTKDGDYVGSAIILHLREHDPIQLIVRGTVIRQLPGTISFGKIKRGNFHKKQFIVRSLNDKPLHILEANARDGLFTVDYRRSSTNLLDALVSVQLENDVPDGYFDVPLEIITDDDVAPIKRIRIQGYVMRPVEAEPSILMFGTIALNETKTRVIRLRPTYGDPISVDHVEVDPQDVIECNAPQIAGPDGSMEMSITVKGNFPSRILNGTVNIYVRVNEEMRKCTVTCYAMRKRPL